MGFGSTETRDDSRTNYPQLILVKASVSVATKTTFRFDNPNGWYCLAANVTVAANTIVNAHCGTHVADARSGAAVIASTETGTGGGARLSVH